MEKVEIEIIDLTFFKLFFKNFLHLTHICEVVAGELIRKIKALARILLKRSAHNELGMSVMISPSGIEIVYALFYCVLHHFANGGLVYIRLVVAQLRQAHSAHSER